MRQRVDTIRALAGVALSVAARRGRMRVGEAEWCLRVACTGTRRYCQAQQTLREGAGSMVACADRGMGASVPFGGPKGVSSKPSPRLIQTMHDAWDLGDGRWAGGLTSAGTHPQAPQAFFADMASSSHDPPPQDAVVAQPSAPIETGVGVPPLLVGLAHVSLEFDAGRNRWSIIHLITGERGHIPTSSSEAPWEICEETDLEAAEYGMCFVTDGESSFWVADLLKRHVYGSATDPNKQFLADEAGAIVSVAHARRMHDTYSFHIAIGACQV